MKRLLFLVSISIIAISSAAVPVFGQADPAPEQKPALAEDVLKQLGTTAEKAELAARDPRLIIAETIQLMLSLVGILFVALIVTAGYWRFTAHGEEEKIQKSNKTILGAVIGLFLILLSYGIAEFVVRRVQNAVQEEQIYDASNQGPPQDQWSIPFF